MGERRRETEPPAQTQPAPAFSPNPPSPNSPENPAAALAYATGTGSPELAMKLLREVVDNRLQKLDAVPVAAPADDDAVDRAAKARKTNESHAMTAALAALGGIGPRDAMEGMLAAQMVAVHDAAMDCLHGATDPRQPVPYREADMRLAARLMTLYGRHMELLDRRRGRAPVAVGRVQVEPGGQAIVGTVNARGGERE